MSRTMAVVVAVLVSMLAAGVTGVASYATGQGSRMSADQVETKMGLAVDRAEESAERRAELHTERLLSDQEEAHAKELKRAKKTARRKGYQVGKKSGYQEGNEAGYSSGYSSGNSAGYESGHSDGIDEGSDELTCSDDSDVALPPCYLWDY